MVGIAGVHNDDNPILNSFLTDGEHNLVELFLTGPFLSFITDKGGDTLNGFQLGCLISGRSFDTTEHDTTTGHSVYDVRLSCLEIFRGTVQIYLFHHFRNDRHTGRYHRVTGIKNLMDNLLYGGHFKCQPLYEGRSVERLPRATATGNENDKLLTVGV